MKLYQKLGLADGSVDPGFFLEGLKKIQAAPDRDDNRHDNKWSLAMEYHGLATAYYLRDDRAEARRWAQMVAPALDDYFHGGWRRTTPGAGQLRDVNWWKQQSMWLHELQVGFVWGMSIGDWASVRRLAEYPDENCLQSLHGGAGADPRSRALLYLALARFICDDRDKAHYWLGQGVSDSRWYGPLGESLRDLMAGDGPGASKHLVEALRRHRARSRKPRRIDLAFDPDSTILYHLLSRHCLEPELPKNLVDYLIRL